MLAQVVPGEVPEVVARRIEALVHDVTVQTRQEFAAQERKVINDMSTDVITIMNLVGVLIGMAVMALTVYTATLARRSEYVAPGAPAVHLADVSTWQIETTDLTELDVVRVRVGSPVTMTFDALPELELTGTVSRIRLLGENKQGDITYVVTITPDRQDERLRWNMTAAISIAPR